MLGPILAIAAPIVVQALRWFGFKEEQIQKFLDWVAVLQREAPDSTIPADEEAKARAALKARIDQEQGK